jgi:hypothetical protein
VPVASTHRPYSCEQKTSYSTGSIFAKKKRSHK